MEEIKVLDDREQARQKISIWFGSADNYYHPIKEVIANGIDEINNNFDSGEIKVFLNEDNKTVSVVDNGRGIPFAGKTGEYDNWELLFLKLFAGTKYDNVGNNTGTNGVGNTVINYTSTKFEVSSYHDGIEDYISFKDGGQLVSKSFSKPNLDIHGTKETFTLDDKVYTNTVFDSERVKEILKRFAICNNKIKFKFYYKDEVTKYHFPSIKDYFNDQVSSQTTSKVFGVPEQSFDEENETNSYDIYFTTTPISEQESYLNGTYLEHGGAIEEGVLDAVRLFGNKYAKANKMFPKGVKSFRKEDVERSVSLIANAKSTKVEFENQTKLATNKKLYRKQAKMATTTILELAEIENPTYVAKLFKHVLEVQKNNTINDKAQRKLKKKLAENIETIGNRVDKLVDSKNHGIDSELFIAEGLSALGSVVQSRDPEYQAVMPLRGKILNVMKASQSQIFENEVITDLIKIIGTGVSLNGRKIKDFPDFDINKARFGKIMIATDADADGFQIAALVISMLYKLMRPLVEQGRVYITKTPLYIVKFSDDRTIYYHSEDEKNKNIGKLKQPYTISRLKGLGEVPPEVMEATAMNKATRDITQVTIEDAAKLSESIETWLGIAVDPRKKEINKHLGEYVAIVD